MLRKKRLQNKIAASRFSLPVTATLAALVWVAVGFIMDNIWAQFAFTIISTLLMVELNNRNSLMRTYSRMVSCSFLMLITMASLPNPSMKASIVTMCFIAFTLIIWNSYQDRKAAGWAFYAYFCIGLASLVFIQVIYYLPILWLCMIFFSNSFSARTFLASLIGVIAPYWFVSGYFAYTDNLQALSDHFTAIIDYQELFDYSQITLHQLINYGFIIILGLLGTIHFIQSSYADTHTHDLRFIHHAEHCDLGIHDSSTPARERTLRHHDSQHGSTHRPFYHLYQRKDYQYCFHRHYLDHGVYHTVQHLRAACSIAAIKQKRMSKR